jgi:hypothetical protein
VKLIGEKSNRDGIGAVVRVTSGSERQWQMMRSGSSYLSQSELVLTFGLGPNAASSAVEITWPGGARQTLENVAADQTITVTEGRGITSSRPYSKRRGQDERTPRQTSDSRPERGNAARAHAPSARP